MEHPVSTSKPLVVPVIDKLLWCLLAPNCLWCLLAPPPRSHYNKSYNKSITYTYTYPWGSTASVRNHLQFLFEQSLYHHGSQGSQLGGQSSQSIRVLSIRVPELLASKRFPRDVISSVAPLVNKYTIFSLLTLTCDL